MKANTVIKVYSDNYDGQLMTFDAYKELRLQMSTGDFHTHKTEIVETDDTDAVISLEDFLLEVE
jgi:hypothetical protein